MTFVNVVLVVTLAAVGGYAIGRAGKLRQSLSITERSATPDAGPAERVVVIGIALASIVGLVVILSVLAWLGLSLKDTVLP